MNRFFVSVCCLIIFSSFQFSNSNYKDNTGYQRFSTSYGYFQKNFNNPGANQLLFPDQTTFAIVNSSHIVNSSSFEFKENGDYLKKGIGVMDSKESNISEVNNHRTLSFAFNNNFSKDANSKMKVIATFFLENNHSRPNAPKSSILRI